MSTKTTVLKQYHPTTQYFSASVRYSASCVINDVLLLIFAVPTVLLLAELQYSNLDTVLYDKSYDSGVQLTAPFFVFNLRYRIIVQWYDSIHSCVSHEHKWFTITSTWWWRRRSSKKHHYVVSNCATVLYFDINSLHLSHTSIVMTCMQIHIHFWYLTNKQPKPKPKSLRSKRHEGVRFFSHIFF